MKLIAALSVCALAFASSAAPQPIPVSTLTGTVRDGSGAVVRDATIIVTATQGQAVRETARTDDRGRYVVRALPPGTYVVEAAAPGFAHAARGGVALMAGQTGVVDVELTIGRIEQAVAVAGAAPQLLDVGNTAHVTPIDEELLQALPVRRSLAALANLAPGVHDDVALGSTERAVAMTLDGTSASEPAWGAPIIHPNINWIEDVTVSTTGVGVAAADSTGARVAGRLRSGTAQFHGLGEYWTVPGWVGDNRGGLPESLRDRFTPLEVLEQWGANGQAGGPLLADRVWFFAGAERLRHDTRSAAFRNTPRTDDEPFTTATESSGVAKLTAALPGRVRPEAFYSYDSGTGRGLNAAPDVQPEAYLSARTIERAWGAGFTWPMSNRSLLQMHYGGHAVVVTNEPTPPNAQSGPMPRFDGVTGIWSGNAPFVNRMTSKPQMMSAAFSREFTAFGNAHQVQAGGEIGSDRLSTENGYPGGGYYTDMNGVPAQLDVWAGGRYAPRQRHTALYVQDTWHASSRLTMIGGVRVASSHGSVPVRGTVISAHPFAPRFGLTWDATGAHDTVVRAFAGREHEPLYTSDYDYLDPSRDSIWRTYRVSADGALTLLEESVPSSRVGIQPNVRLPRVDELSASVERILPAGLAMRIEYVRRAYRDFIVTSDVGSTYLTTTTIDPGVDGLSNTADDGPVLTVFDNADPTASFLLLTNTSDAFRNYRALRVTMTRTSSRGLSLQGSYTWSSDHGSIGNGAGNRAGLFDGGTGGSFADPNRAVNRIGPMPFDAPHEAKVFGSWVADRLWGMRLSGVARVQTGRPWERQLRVRGLAQGIVAMRAEPRGSRRTAIMSTIDLRLDVPVLPLHHSRTTLYLDVYNALNSGYATGVQPIGGPAFGTPSGWSAPRTGTVGLRATF